MGVGVGLALGEGSTVAGGTALSEDTCGAGAAGCDAGTGARTKFHTPTPIAATTAITARATETRCAVEPGAEAD